MGRNRIEGVGDIEVRMELRNNVIRSINVMGDYFLVGDIDNRVLRPLRGKSLERQSIESVLPEKMDDIILNLKRDDFVTLLLTLKEQRSH